MSHSQSRPRLAWKKEQDDALKHLKQDLKIQKWTEIAEKLTSIYQIQNRNHQQCRDRYVNFLEKNIQNKQWPHEDFQKLIDLYFIYGNKWSEIADHFQNKNGLLVKNKFYSRLRKGIRNINFLIQTFLSDSWEKFNFKMTFKLINCAANKFDFSEKSSLGKKLVNHITFVEEIVKNVFNISWLEKRELRKAFKSQSIENFNQENINKLIEDINFIDQNFDKKHSNRRAFKQRSSRSLSPNSVPVKQEELKGQTCSRPSNKVEEDKIRISCVQLSQIAHPFNKPKVQIISINSFEKNSQCESYGNENDVFKGFQNYEECSQRREDCKRREIRYSGYKQRRSQNIKQQAHEGDQLKFFQGQNFFELDYIKKIEEERHAVCQD